MKIGELAHQAGVDPPTIRYYESVGVLPEPERNSVGYRTYSSADLERLQFVVSARSLGLRLDDIRETLNLRSSGETPCTYVRQLIDREVEAVKTKIRELKALSDELEAMQRIHHSEIACQRADRRFPNGWPLADTAQRKVNFRPGRSRAGSSQDQPSLDTTVGGFAPSGSVPPRSSLIRGESTSRSRRPPTATDTRAVSSLTTITIASVSSLNPIAAR